LIRAFFSSPASYFDFALQIVLDIHRGCTADYAAGWEPYLVWFTRFQEKPALALPHLRWPPLLPQ
jgi:hypothetical protein